EDATSEVTNELESQINAIKGGGRPLAESERAYFEPRFGADFSQVRVHTDTQAAETARAVNAKAYTLGQDVVFGAEQYAPETAVGRRLLAHELTHVVQQTSPSDSLATLQTSPLRWDIIQRTLTDEQVTARAQNVHRLFRAHSRNYSALDAVLVNETAPHVLQVYQEYENEFGQGSFQRDLSTFVSRIPPHPGQTAVQVEAERDSYWDRYAARLYDAGVIEIQRAYHSARQIVYTESNGERWRREYVHNYFAAGGGGGSLDYAPLALWVSGFRWSNLRSGNAGIQRLGWLPSFSPSSLRLCIQVLSAQPDVHALGVRETDNYFRDIWQRYRFALDDGRGMNGYGTRNKIASYQDHYDIQRSHAQRPNPLATDLRQEIRDWYETWRAAASNFPNTRDPQRAPNQWIPAWWNLLGRWDRNERISDLLKRQAGIG
ncbi:MAG: DUF4157 domain-containing protein, partial [ANME-2 cluster archaeon]|nr:DUF4157 domain-containing protein [ANME-2 cluster archaeon]